MKNFYCFHVHPHVPFEVAWEELEEMGIELAYGSEEEPHSMIYGYSENIPCLSTLTSLASYSLAELPSIDWEAQWALHGWNFQEGMAHIQLSDFGFKNYLLKLKPGPGFGDLSHPTTRIVLNLMSKRLGDAELVVDIGCGSGILAIAAAAAGVPLVYGIDIDVQALEHSYVNACLNKLEHQCHFGLPDEFNFPFSKRTLVVMNMILSEQKEALHALPSLSSCQAVWITSGIRVEERAAYLTLIDSWNGKCLEEHQEEEWVGFVFEKKQ